MSSLAGEILSNIRDCLAASGAFAAVLTGHAEDSASWPRAEVTLTGLDCKPADDRPAAQWAELKAKVCIYVHHLQPAGALRRALELAGAAAQALLEDRFRGQKCRDLPLGAATEIGPARIEPNIKPPYLAVSVEVRCHFES